MHLFNPDKLERMELGGEINTYNSDMEIIENKHIFLTDDVHITGKITFFSCIINMLTHSISSEDIFVLENCSVGGAAIETDSVSPAIDTPHGEIRNCAIENFPYRDAVRAKIIKYTDFVDCKCVICGYGIGLNVLECSTFMNCANVRMENARLNTCRFVRATSISVNGGDIANCIFEGSVCQKHPLISIIDGDIILCDFKEIILLQDQHLIAAKGKVSIDDCEYKDIQTARADKALVTSITEVKQL